MPSVEAREVDLPQDLGDLLHVWLYMESLAIYSANIYNFTWSSQWRAELLNQRDQLLAGLPRQNVLVRGLEHQFRWPG